jgi:methionine sulfoxide reductase heme-binding subunit
MTQGQWIRRVVKPAAFVGCLVPAALIIAGVFNGGLGADPIKEITHRTGKTALVMLMLTLGVTPMRRITGLGALVNLRRMLGLFAFFYATLHFATYIVLDQFFAFGEILVDIGKRPYITVGFTAFVLLIPLAITSTNGWIRRLGGRRWSRLHQLVYVSAAGGVLHYLWLVKADTRTPIIYGLVLVGLLSTRLIGKKRRRVAPASASGLGPVPASPAPAVNPSGGAPVEMNAGN